MQRPLAQPKLLSVSRPPVCRFPAGFTSTSNREAQALQRIAQFTESWRAAQQAQPGRQPPLLEPLALPNECGVLKPVCTTLRPTCLPHVELHDLGGITQVGVR